ncbi:hypothetical protein D3C76_769280 [compost metagenome]
MDFVGKPLEFAPYLGNAKREWSKAQENFLGLVEHWQSLCTEQFGGLVSVIQVNSKPELQGVVIDKAYAVELRPITVGESGFAEVVIKVLFSDAVHAEAGRFLVNRRGNVVKEDGTVLVDIDSDYGSFTIFTSIAKVVLETPYPKIV